MCVDASYHLLNVCPSVCVRVCVCCGVAFALCIHAGLWMWHLVVVFVSRVLLLL